MPRKTSFCNGALLRSDLKRYWPLLFVYTAILLLALPVQLMRTDNYSENALRLESNLRDVLLANITAGMVIALLTGLLVAMAVFSYLMAARSTGLMHALPLSRTCQFTTHCIAGFGAVTAGNVLVFLLSLLVLAGKGVMVWDFLLLWLVSLELAELFFFGLGALCAVATGWLLAIPALYAAANCAAILLWAVVSYMADIFYFGYTNGGIPAAINWLTPVSKLVTAATDYSGQQLPLGDASVYMSDLPVTLLPTAAIYAAIGVVLLVLAWYLYCKRPSESAGDAMSFRWLRPVARWTIGLCGGLGLGLFLNCVVLYNSNAFDSLPRMLPCQVIMGTLCFLGTQMLLQKRFRVLRRCWKELAAFVVVLCAVTVCIRLDITGYQTRVPDAQSVKQVSVYGSSFDLTDCDDPAAIELVTQLHRATAAQGGTGDNIGNSFGPAVPLDEGVYHHFSLRYDLDGDGIADLRRVYTVPVTPGSELHTLLNELAGLPQCRREVIGLHRYDQDTVTILGGTVIFEDYTTGDYATAPLTAEQARELYRLAEEDALSGAPIDVLETNIKEESCCYTVSLDINVSGTRYTSWDLYIPDSCTATRTYIAGLSFTDMDGRDVPATAPVPDSADIPSETGEATSAQIIGGADTATTTVIYGAY